jgi:hypothetical protein
MPTTAEFRNAVVMVRARGFAADEDRVSDELRTSAANVREAAIKAEAEGLVRIIRQPNDDEVYEPIAE